MVWHDTIVVGAGPAGLQMGYYLHKRKRDYLILEQENSVGSFFQRFPRHRKLISINKRHNFFPEAEFNMRHDWNSLLTDDYSLRMTDYSTEMFPSADAYVQYLNDFYAKFQLQVSFRKMVLRVHRRADGAGFLLVVRDKATGQEEKYECKTLLMATGVVGPWKPSDCEGIDLAENYETFSTDVSKYTNKRVLVIGGGNSGFEVANDLSEHASIIHVAIKRPVRHAWDTHFVGDLRAINNGLLDMYQLKSLHATLGNPPTKIERTDNGTFLVSFLEYIGHVDIAVGELTLQREYDFVIRATGVRWVTPLLFAPECRPRTHTTEKYPVLTPCWQAEGVEDLYFIGGSMQAIDRKAASGFIHGFRYLVRSLFHLLEWNTFGERLPSLSCAAVPLDMCKLVTDRLTTVASLFQCFGVLCDVLCVPSQNTDEARQEQEAMLYTDLPVAWVRALLNSKDHSRDLFFGSAVEHCFIITLEFGTPRYANALSSNNFIQDSGTLNTRCGAFLHPVLVHYHRGVLKQDYHLYETLDLRFNMQYKANASLTTMSFQLLLQVLEQSLELSPAGALLQLSATGVAPDVKRKLFGTALPLDRVWSNEERLAWKSRVEQQRMMQRRDKECELFPLPISKL